MAGTVQGMPTPTGVDHLLNTRLSKTGFQRAHIIGKAFANSFSNDWFGKMLGSNGVNEVLNGVLLPEASRGGAILGSAVHYLEHVEEFNTLFYDADPATNASSTKWLNALEQDLTVDLAGNGFDISSLDATDPEVQAILKEYRIKARNFLDYSKVLFLHQDNLDKLEIEGLKSLVLNRSDIRYSDDFEVSRYLQDLEAQGLLDFDNVENNQLYRKIADYRASLPDADVSIDSWLVTEIPETSRIIYPDGEVKWSDNVRADVMDC